MRFVLLIPMITACASPPPAHPVEIGKSVPDAAVLVAVVDAAPEAQPAIADAATEASHMVDYGPPCAGHSLTHTAHVLRGRIREAGSSSVRQGHDTYSVDWVVIDILEIVSGDEKIAPAFKKSFYATTTTGVMSDTGAHGFGGHGAASDLVPHKGEELLFIAALPDEGYSEGGAVPARFLREYGPREPTLFDYCPLDARDAILAAKERLRRRPR